MYPRITIIATKHSISEGVVLLQIEHEKSGPGLSSTSPDNIKRYLQKVSLFLYFNSEIAYSWYSWNRKSFLTEELPPKEISFSFILLILEFPVLFNSVEIAIKRIIFLS